MVYKRFYIIVIIRVLLILVTSIWFSEALRAPANIYTLLVVSVLLTGQIVSLIYNINSVNRSISRFFDGIEEIGTSVRPHFRIEDASYRNLSRSIIRVADMISETKTENEKQLNYFRFVVNNNPAGILIADSRGKIIEFNRSARSILNTEIMFNLSELAALYPCLEKESAFFEPGYEKTLRINIKGAFEHINIRVSGFKMDKELLRIITLQNLTYEMEENELVSWQKLTRVLTHEIMNSLTPIISLTAAAKLCLTAPGNTVVSGEDIKDALLNLNLIEERSAGIKDFVRSYKRVSQVPALKLSVSDINDLVRSNLKALKEELEKADIHLKTYYSECPRIKIDPGLISQVLDNLIRNAMHAMSETENKTLQIITCYEKSELRIEVKDNGRGIPAEETDEIFMPFYTTRSDGMGIGLSLSRQIMRLHKASIKVKSVPGKETSFMLAIPG